MGWVLVLFFYTSEFVTSMALSCLMYVVLFLSWGLFCGSMCYFLFVILVFFGIGVYIMVILFGQFGWVEIILIGVGIFVVVVVVMGVVVLHLRGTYFVVLIFGMIEFILYVVIYFEKLVIGIVGRVFIVVPERDIIYFMVLVLVVLLVVVFIWV